MPPIQINIINVMERFNDIVKDLKAAGMIVDSEFDLKKGADFDSLHMSIKADNCPR